MKTTVLLSMSLLAIVFAFSNASEPPGTEVSRHDAMAIIGGGCGGELQTKTKNCSTEDNEGHNCDGEEELCSSASVSVEVIDGDGDREMKDDEEVYCNVCGVHDCGSASSVTETKEADCGV